jgi:hypothetical protein
MWYFITHSKQLTKILPYVKSDMHLHKQGLRIATVNKEAIYERVNLILSTVNWNVLLYLP